MGRFLRRLFAVLFAGLFWTLCVMLVLVQTWVVLDDAWTWGSGRWAETLLAGFLTPHPGLAPGLLNLILGFAAYFGPLAYAALFSYAARVWWVLLRPSKKAAPAPHA